MTTMLEKAARAIAADMKRQAVSRDPRYSGNGMVDPDHFANRPLVVTVDHTFHLDELARAVLMAVREPSDAMIDAGLIAPHTMFEAALPHETFPLMIDAILNEDPTA